MEKAIKQRLLGGLVLIAGAALFLPMLLDGAGAPLAVPPMPTPPEVESVEQVAPRLDAEASAAEQSVNAAHADSTFAENTEVPASMEEDVSADAAAAAVSAPAVQAAADKVTQDKAAQDKAAQDKVTQDKIVQVKAAQEKAARLKAEQQKAEEEKMRLAAEAVKKAEMAKKAEAEKKTADAKVAAAKPSTPTATLPEAWVIQVASLSAKDKAEALVSKLRQKNYRAAAHQQGAVWKVVVGPELRRDVADSIKSRLAADPELKLNGWVQAYKP